MADKFYEMLADEAEVHATDKDDSVEIARAGDTVEVRVSAPGAGRPLLRADVPRRRHRRRSGIFLKQGNDRATSAAPTTRSRSAWWEGRGPTSSTTPPAGTRASTTTRARTGSSPAPAPRRATSPTRIPWTGAKYPLRDWGPRRHPVGPDHRRRRPRAFSWARTSTSSSYGFRKHPYASRQTAARRLLDRAQRVQDRVRRRVRPHQQPQGAAPVRCACPTSRTCASTASATRPSPKETTTSTARRSASTSCSRPSASASTPPSTSPSDPSPSTCSRTSIAGRFLTEEQPYGAADFGQVGARAALVVDRRNSPDGGEARACSSPRRARSIPKALDVEENVRGGPRRDGGVPHLRAHARPARRRQAAVGNRTRTSRRPSSAAPPPSAG